MTEDSPEPNPSQHHLRATSAAAVSSCAVAGLVSGWAAHPVGEWVLGTVPQIGWTPSLVLFVAATAIGLVAWQTWRQIHRRPVPLEARLAVNRLVLARASALVGALVAGGYVGFAISWVGTGSELAGERITRSLAAALGGVAVLIGGLALEYACRAPKQDQSRLT